MMSNASVAGEQSAVTPFNFTTTLAATSDYVYRGVSLTNERPTPLMFVEASYGILYGVAFMTGTYLGEDGLGRSIGNIETDATIGIAPSFGIVDFNLGVKYTGYPNGRDMMAGTLDHAERDFIEPFSGLTVHVGTNATVGATVYWTPNFYGQTGEVTTLEGQVAAMLPAVGPLVPKFSAALGRVTSEQRDIVSPGHGYLYYHAGIEARISQIIIDIRYWNTDVGDLDGFDQRVVFSMGVALK